LLSACSLKIISGAVTDMGCGTILHEPRASSNIRRVKGKAVPLLNWLSTSHEGVWKSGCTDPRFIDLGTSWRWVVSLTPRPIYPREKSPRDSLDRNLGGPQSWSRRYGEVKTLGEYPNNPRKLLQKNVGNLWENVSPYKTTIPANSSWVLLLMSGSNCTMWVYETASYGNVIVKHSEN
jgi:hypothetical protein